VRVQQWENVTMNRCLSSFCVCVSVTSATWAADVVLNAPVLEHNMPATASYGVIWETPRSAWMPKCTTAPTLDGKLNDSCWREAAVLTGFVAGSNRTRSYRNRALLCYDDTNLYVGCDFGEPRPDRIKATVKDDNVVNVWTDDCVELRVQVDSQKLFVPQYQGKPTWVQFITNTNGARFSQLVVERRPGSRRDCPTDWNDKWLVGAGVGADAWYVEVAIPWKNVAITPVEGGSDNLIV